MTANAVTDDRKQNIPTAEEVDTYTRREAELRQRFLKGVLDVKGVLDSLQAALELIKGFINCNGRPEIPDWADKQNPIIEHNPGGIFDPSKIEAADVFEESDGDYLEGEEFAKRAQAVEGAMNACAFDFYARPENWKYLASVPREVTVIVFAETIFCNSFGRRCVGYLYRRGAKWDRGYDWVGDRFDRDCRVARVAS